MTQFVMVFDRERGKILSLHTEATAADALRARLEAEGRYGRLGDVEVALLSATDEDALRRTHARYFATIQSIADREVTA